MFFGIYLFFFEIDFLNFDLSDFWVVIDFVFFFLYFFEGFFLVFLLFFVKLVQEVVVRGVSCNNCLFEKYMYNYQLCYVLLCDENVILSKVFVKLVCVFFCSFVNGFKQRIK